MSNKPNKIKRPWKPERKPFQRGKTNYKFYNSRRWRTVSKLYKQQHPVCEKCEAEGKVNPSEFTDHIKRIEDGGAKFDEDNLQALCGFHHNQKSGREAHGYKERSD